MYAIYQDDNRLWQIDPQHPYEEEFCSCHTHCSHRGSPPWSWGLHLVMASMTWLDVCPLHIAICLTKATQNMQRPVSKLTWPHTPPFSQILHIFLHGFSNGENSLLSMLIPILCFQINDKDCASAQFGRMLKILTWPMNWIRKCKLNCICDMIHSVIMV